MPMLNLFRKPKLDTVHFCPAVLIAWGVLSTISGCGKSNEIATVPVQGTVTFKGQPVVGANVFFVPFKGPRATGETDSQGHFQLMTYKKGDGAVPGEYTVGITKFVEDPSRKSDTGPALKNELPDKYSNPATSNFTAKVEVGKKYDLPFEITE